MRIRSTRDVAAIARGRRTDLRMTQAELARRAGVSRKAISEFERGKTQPVLGLAIRILNELGLAIEMGGTTRTREGRRKIDLDAVLEEHRKA